MLNRDTSQRPALGRKSASQVAADRIPLSNVSLSPELLDGAGPGVTAFVVSGGVTPFVGETGGGGWDGLDSLRNLTQSGGLFTHLSIRCSTLVEISGTRATSDRVWPTIGGIMLTRATRTINNAITKTLIIAHVRDKPLRSK